MLYALHFLLDAKVLKNPVNYCNATIFCMYFTFANFASAASQIKDCKYLNILVYESGF